MVHISSSKILILLQKVSTTDCINMVTSRWKASLLPYWYLSIKQSSALAKKFQVPHYCVSARLSWLLLCTGSSINSQLIEHPFETFNFCIFTVWNIFDPTDWKFLVRNADFVLITFLCWFKMFRGRLWMLMIELATSSNASRPVYYHWGWLWLLMLIKMMMMIIRKTMIMNNDAQW